MPATQASSAASDAALAASHAYCLAQTRQHAASFYFASMALPPEKKRAAFAVYAFCRYVDDTVDRARSRAEAQAGIGQIGADFDRLASGAADHLPFAPAFAWAVRRFGIEREPFQALLKGVGSDAGPVRIADWPQLREYCYQVASVVGLMMARIFELKDAAAQQCAVELGLAMQLTNIVRDVGEDYRADRVYLPAAEMNAYQVTEADLGAAEAGARIRALLEMQIARARQFYRSAEAGIPHLADDGSQLTVWLMRHVYAGILEEVERMDYQVLGRRARVSLPRKSWLAWRAWRDYRRTRSNAGRIR
jgi:phytoene synthase